MFNNYKLDTYLTVDVPLYHQLYKHFDWCENSRGMTKASMKSKTGAIRQFVRFAKIEDVREITNEMVDNWMAFGRKRGIKGITINDYYKHVRAMIKWFKDCDYKMPYVKLALLCRTAEEPTRCKFFNEEQVIKALAYADRREWLMIKLAFDCGLRISELCSLRLANLTPMEDGRYMRIVGKGGKERPVVMSEEAKIRLDDWIDREKITDYIFPNPSRTNHLCTNACRIKMETVFRKAGFYDMQPHDLRRSFASDLDFKGAEYKEIQNGMGHASIETTQHYLKRVRDREVIDLYSLKYQNAPANLR